jgi:threonine/homoserine/homoserine lactone efflux protein
MFFAINGARFGFGNTLTANFSYHLATWIVTYAIGLAFLSGLSETPEFLLPLKYAGSIYIAYLSFKLFRAGAIDGTSEAKPANFLDGALLLVLNPKAYVIIFLLFTQFLTVTNSEKHLYLIAVTTLFTLNNCIAFTVWTILGDQLLKKFRNPKNARILNKIFGASLFLVGVWILVR